jgi:hypothetical protein
MLQHCLNIRVLPRGTWPDDFPRRNDFSWIRNPGKLVILSFAQGELEFPVIQFVSTANLPYQLQEKAFYPSNLVNVPYYPEFVTSCDEGCIGAPPDESKPPVILAEQPHGINVRERYAHLGTVRISTTQQTFSCLRRA